MRRELDTAGHGPSIFASEVSLGEKCFDGPYRITLRSCVERCQSRCRRGNGLGATALNGYRTAGRGTERAGGNKRT